MTTEPLKQQIKAWLEFQVVFHPDLDDIPIVLSGEAEDAEFPLIVIEDNGSDIYEQDGVIMRGVMTLTIAVRLLSVPCATNQAGTDIQTHRDIARALYSCLADSTMRDFIDTSNEVRLFDIRAASPTMETDPPRRRSTIELTAIAAPF